MEEFIELLATHSSTWLKKQGFEWLSENIKWIVKITVVISTVIIPMTVKGVTRIKEYLQRRRLNRDLHPFYTPSEIRKATQYYIPTKCQNVAPSREDEPRQNTSFAVRENLISFFLNKAFNTDNDEQRFYIILADSGMGKTTFMINLYLRYVQQFWGKKYNIRLFPLGSPRTDEKIDRIREKEEEANTILLLDALDEDYRAVKDYKQRLEEIISKVQDFREVVITCRTQFFPTEDEEPYETGVFKFGDDRGEHTFHKLYVSPFDDNDVRRYLDKKFGIFRIWNYKKKQKAKRILKHSPNLMVRPMLLSYIDTLLNSNRTYEYSYQIYEELIARWIEREAKRVDSGERDKFRRELQKFSRAIAIDIYRNRQERKGLFMSAMEIRIFAEKHGIELLELEMRSRSLLNRNAQGQYKFSHKSVLEYFLAKEAFENKDFKKELNFKGMEQAEKFYIELCHEHYTVPFFNRKDLKGGFRTHASSRTQPLSKIRAEDLQTLYQISMDISGVDMRVLKGLRNLKKLDLSHTPISDISGLKELRDLERLDLSHTKVSDIAALKEMRSLKVLHLSNTPIVDISPVRELDVLRTLNVSHTEVSDISPVRELKLLEVLDLNNTPVSDISSLVHLATLQILDLNHTQVSDIGVLNELKNLVYIYLNNTPIRHVEALKGLQQLKGLRLNYTQVDNIGVLAGLKNLEYLNLKNTPIHEVNMLKELPNLRVVSLRNNSVSPVQVEELRRALPDCEIEY